MSGQLSDTDIMESLLIFACCSEGFLSVVDEQDPELMEALSQLTAGGNIDTNEVETSELVRQTLTRLGYFG